MPFGAAETVRRGRLGPGELLLVEPGRRAILEDAEAKAWALRALPIHDAARPMYEDRVVPEGGAPGRAAATAATPTDHVLRYLAGLDAERARLDIKTMALSVMSGALGMVALTVSTPAANDTVFAVNDL